jgi:hypothetical protein
MGIRITKYNLATICHDFSLFFNFFFILIIHALIMNLFVLSLPSVFLYILPRIQIHMSNTGIAVGVADPDPQNK